MGETSKRTRFDFGRSGQAELINTIGLFLIIVGAIIFITLILPSFVKDIYGLLALTSAEVVARDIAGLITVSAAAPHDIIIEYQASPDHEFNVEIANRLVWVKLLDVKYGMKGEAIAKTAVDDIIYVAEGVNNFVITKIFESGQNLYDVLATFVSAEEAALERSERSQFRPVSRETEYAALEEPPTTTKMLANQWARYSSSPPFTSTQGAQSIEDLKKAIPHTDYISMDVFINSIDVDPEPRTSYIDEYGPAVQHAKDLGFKVHWRVQPRMDPASEINRLYFVPADVDAWFERYTDAVVYWATKAEQYGVEDFSISTELSNLEIYNSQWRDLIQEVKKVYTGRLGYNTNFWWQDSEFKDKESAVWMQDLDYIGVSAYWKMCDSAGPSVDELVQNWHSYVGGGDLKGEDIVEEHLKVLSQIHDKPIVIVTGLQSAEGACLTPWDWNRKTVDLQEQENWYEAVFRVFYDKEWVHGFKFDGTWQTSASKRDNPDNYEFTVQGKPAEQTIENWFENLT